MYEQAQSEIDRILTIVKTCPQELQAKCFEILLQGYVESQMSRRVESSKDHSGDAGRVRAPVMPGGATPATGIPAEVRTRINTIAGQRGVGFDELAGLFDFSVDPFTYGPITVAPNAKNADRARKVALLVALKNYLATGKWLADWDEVKRFSTDHGCYDGPNFAQNMKNSKGTIFKAVNVGASVELSNEGIKQAQALLADLATNAAK